MTLQALRMILEPLIKDTPFAGKTWFAGGCVRDYLMQSGTPMANDVDITVELPQGGIRLAEHLSRLLNLEPPRCHPEFFTASLSLQGCHLEFVATRKELYRYPSRYPKVIFGSLSDDVMRRDFTINSLLQNVTTGEISDLDGRGLADMEGGIIRSMGLPETKFREDPLRMLRAVRFALRFGLAMEETTRSALVSQAKHLGRLSQRLFNTELTKMRQDNEQTQILAQLNELGWTSLSRIRMAVQEIMETNYE